MLVRFLPCAVSLVVQANLVDTLTGTGPFTVFAPSNEAFAKLPASTVTYLLNNVAALKNVLLYHVAAGRVLLPSTLAGPNYTPSVGDRSQIVTAQASNLTVYLEEQDVYINYAHVDFVNIGLQCTNGVIYLIDTVLIPQAVAAQIAAQAEISAQAPVKQATLNLVQLAQSVPSLSTLGTGFE